MKEIKKYEGLYAITSCGKVWSYKRKKFLKSQINRGGYEQVCLCKNNKKKIHTVHRLVAETYIPNPENKPQVNHRDEDKTNNSVSNLEWLTLKENINYGTGIKRRQKQIFCVELSRAFPSVRQASKETQIHEKNISACAIGKKKTAGGYHWCYTGGM